MLQDYLFELLLSYYEGLIQYQGNHLPSLDTYHNCSIDG